MTQVVKMLKALDKMQRTMGKRSEANSDLTVTWVEILFHIAAAGEKGITSKELEQNIQVAQGIISRTTKYLGVYKNRVTGKMEGYGFVSKTKDPDNLHRDLILLTSRGKKFMAEIEQALS